METATPSRTWRILELIHWTTDYLKDKGFPTPKTDVEWLLTAVLHCSRMQLYTDFEKPLTPAELLQFKGLLKERLTHKPVQYLIGETDFMGLTFQLNEQVLIPRPETELLVEEAVEYLRKCPEEQQRVLDIGTGSGCIAVSIAALVPRVRVWGIDNSESALDVANSNAGLHHVTEQVIFRNLDILSDDPPDIPFPLIVSNPPYISPDDFERIQKDVREFEPREALVAEENGLRYYKHFARHAQNWLIAGGRLMLEIGGTHQAQSINDIFTEAGWEHVTIRPDYNGQDRILSAISK